MLQLSELQDVLESKQVVKLYEFLKNREDWPNDLIVDSDEEGQGDEPATVLHVTILHLIVGFPNAIRDSYLVFLLNMPQISGCKNQDYINRQAGEQDMLNWTAAHIAACWGYSSTLRILLRYGADPSIRDSEGLTVRNIAEIYDNHHCTLVLDQEASNNQQKLKQLLSTPPQIDKDLSIGQTEEDNNNSEDYSVIDISDESIAEFVPPKSLKEGEEVECRAHQDKRFGVTLLEVTRRFSRVPYDQGDGNLVGKEPMPEVIEESILNLDDDKLRKNLLALGDSPGPITATTKQFYRRRYQRLKRQSIFVLASPGKSLPLPSYSREINSLILGELNFPECKLLEKEFHNLFEGQGPSKKNYFTYLLLDPRITRNLPEEAFNSSFKQFDGQLFKRFVQAIFYVGKGQGNRPFMHLYEAVRTFNDNLPPPNQKIAKVLDIWAQNCGVVSLHSFHTITSNEALARECLMIEALGLNNLTNIQIGQNKLRELKWTDYKKKALGAYFLSKVYNTYVQNGEQQIHRQNLK